MVGYASTVARRRAPEVPHLLGLALASFTTAAVVTPSANPNSGEGLPGRAPRRRRLGGCRGPYMARSAPNGVCRTPADLDVSPLTWGFWLERAKGIEPS